jgi:hypothetical protein
MPKNGINYSKGEVARERFELSSRAPEAPMLDHYTTGLQSTPSKTHFLCNNFSVALFTVLFFEGVSDAVAALVNWSPVLTAF